MEMKYNRFIAALFDLRKDPPPLLIITFIAGLLFFGILVNALYDFANGQSINVVCVAILLAFLVIAAVICYSLYARTISPKPQVLDARSIKPMKCVITGISPYQPASNGRPDNFKLHNLIKHHAEQIERIYLVGTFSDMPVNADEGVEGTYNKLKEYLDDSSNQPQFPKLKVENIHKIQISDPDSAKNSFDAVDTLLKKLGQEKIISMSDIAIDITDGRKPMSIGLALAALYYDCHVSYLTTERNIEGLTLKNGNQSYIELETSISIGKISTE
jgi:hypothetical protein